MDKAKRRRLETRGWRVGMANDFLGLSAEEAALVEMKVSATGVESVSGGKDGGGGLHRLDGPAGSGAGRARRDAPGHCEGVAARSWGGCLTL